MVKSAIIGYMEKTFLVQFDEDITEATDLFKAGIVDSHGYIGLMQYIQATFHIKFSKDELLSNVITSLSGIVATVEAKLAKGGSN